MTKKIREEWERLSLQLGDSDPRLREIIKRVGPPRVSLETNRFRALCESILSQQLATKAAASIIGRFTALEAPFPSAERILKLRVTQFRRCGVSGSKTTYLRELSKAWKDELSLLRWGNLEDAEIVERLTAVKGIGVWTAQMFLIFSLGRPDVLPTGDFGVRKGMQLVYGLSEAPTPQEMVDLLSHWKGASSIGSWYMWRALDLYRSDGELRSS